MKVKLFIPVKVATIVTFAASGSDGSASLTCRRGRRHTRFSHVTGLVIWLF